MGHCAPANDSFANRVRAEAEGFHIAETHVTTCAVKIVVPRAFEPPDHSAARATLVAAVRGEAAVLGTVASVLLEKTLIR
jgi:hypothetical protein